MYQALYRKYRPRFFKDVAGQEHITSVLAKEVAEHTFGHAYIFTGSRGIGKTTCAKILAKAVNCPNEHDGEPCGECEICRGIDDGSLLDVTEMDAASNRNIDDIRNLRAEANFTPAIAKYRVYIIDEAHMLTKEAANALLKIMEEPPEHVIFILATTEVYKLPATILSRCMRFDFKRMQPQVIAERVKFVCKMEHIEIDDDAAQLIGELADGGMRDALSLLDICRADERITVDTVSRCAGLAGREYLFDLADCVAKKDTAAVLEMVDKLYQSSADVGRLCDEMISHFRSLMVVSCSNEAASILKVLPKEEERLKAQAKTISQTDIFYCISVLQEATAKMAKSASKRLEFELAMVKLCSPELLQSPEALLARIEKLESEIALLKARGVASAAVPAQTAAVPAAESIPARTEAAPQAPAPSAQQSARQQKAVAPVSKAPEEPAESDSARLFAEWDMVVDLLAHRSPMLCALLTGSKAYESGNRLLIDAPNDTFIPYMQKSPDANESIKTAITEVCGRRYGIGPYKKAAQSAANDPLEELAKRAQASGIELL